MLLVRNNLFFSFLTSITKSIANLFLFFMIARFVSVSEFGQFSFSYMIAILISIVVDYGYGIRLPIEVSKFKDKISDYTVSTFKLKSYIAIIVITILFLLNITILSNQTFNLVFLLTFSTILYCLGVHFLLPFRSIDKFQIESWVITISNIMVLISSYLLLKNNFGLIQVSYAIIFSRIVLLIISFIVYCNYFNFIFKTTKTNIGTEIRLAFPFMLHVFIAFSYLNIDSIIIKEYSSNYNLGIYQAGMRALAGFLLFTEVINNVLIPKISSSASNKKILKKYFIYFFKLSLFIGCFILLIINVYNEELVRLFFGEKYFQLSQYIYLFSIIVFIRYASIAYGCILSIFHKQKERLYILIFSLTMIVLLDLIIVPIHGIKGALVVSICAHIFIFISYAIISHRIIKRLNGISYL